MRVEGRRGDEDKERKEPFNSYSVGSIFPFWFGIFNIDRQWDFKRSFSLCSYYGYSEIRSWYWMLPLCLCYCGVVVFTLHLLYSNKMRCCRLIIFFYNFIPNILNILQGSPTWYLQLQNESLTVADSGQLEHISGNWSLATGAVA